MGIHEELERINRQMREDLRRHLDVLDDIRRGLDESLKRSEEEARRWGRCADLAWGLGMLLAVFGIGWAVGVLLASAFPWPF